MGSNDESFSNTHSVVKQADSYRVRELVKKIENHTHRQSLQRDLQQNNAYNPELFETDPETQCKECRLYWSQGIVYCTCGHLLKESEGNRGAIQCTLDLLSFPNYVIKNGRPHGHRYGKTTEQREYHVAHPFLTHLFLKLWAMKCSFCASVLP